MTNRELALCAARHQSTSVIPHQLDVTAGMHEILTSYFGDPDYLYTIADNCLVREKNKANVYHDGGYTDIFGVRWLLDSDGAMGVPERHPLQEIPLDKYDWPVPDDARIRAQIRSMNAMHPDRLRIFELSFALFERAWTLRGMEPLLIDMLEEPDSTDRLLDILCDYCLRAIDIAADESIDCVMFGDDWGQQRGLIMGKPLWFRFIQPRLAIMYERVKRHGLLIAQHSCGDNRELLGSLIDIGLDVYNTFQPEIYDLEAFAREYGGCLTIYGGISTQGVMRFGTPKQVREATLRAMDLLGRFGYIAAPTHQLTRDTPIQNVLAFLEATTHQ